LNTIKALLTVNLSNQLASVMPLDVSGIPLKHPDVTKVVFNHANTAYHQLLIMGVIDVEILNYPFS